MTQHAKLLNALVEMQESHVYAARKSVLMQAESLIVVLKKQRDEAHKQLFEIRALVGAQTEELIQDVIKRLIAERDQCKADFEAQFNV